MIGLFQGLDDPEAIARREERARIVAKIAEQMGISKPEAAHALWYFEATTSSLGETVN